MKAEDKTEQSFITQALMRTKRVMWYAFLFSFCSNVLLLAPSVYSMQVLDRVISSASLPTLINLTIIITFALIFYGAFGLVKAQMLAQTGEWLDTKVNARLLAIGVMQNSIGSAAPASQYLRDMQNIKAFITGNGASTLLDAPWSVIYLLVIYMINPILGLVTLLGGLVLLVFAILNELLTRKPAELASKAQLRSMIIADTATRNAESIEAMGMMPNVTALWQQENDQGQIYQRRAMGRANILQSVTRVIRMFIQILITGVGAWLAIHNEASTGGMIAASILSGRGLAPFEAAIGIWKGFLTARESYKRLEKTAGKFPQLRGTMQLPAPQGYLSVENVIFSPPGKGPVLKGISLSLQPGEVLGIIGPSAAGKSTLAKIITGILPPTAGTVRLDGAEIFKWNRELLGPYIGYMPQNVDLFNGTVLQNIARLSPNPDHEAVIEAAQLASVHEMILRLPEGYETVIRPGNSTLSPGQRQRLGLARALYGRPKFLVLDEPNLNLDGEGEKALIAALGNIRKLGITTIVVAHRPNLVNATDKLLIMQDGRTKEFGPTRQLLGKYTAPTISEAGADA